MGDQYYRKFFYTLKRFAYDDKYNLSYELFNIKSELRFDNKYQVFYVISDGVKKYVSFKDAYMIIKDNIFRRLQYMQISNFKYHTKSKNRLKQKMKNKNKNFVLSDAENRIYKLLIDLFIPYLYEEYFIPLNVFENVDVRTIFSCFYDLDISASFLRKFLEIACFDKSSFYEACISKKEIYKTFSDEIWYKNLKQFNDKGYIILKEKDGNINEIYLTEKFLKTLKKLTFLIFAS